MKNSNANYLETLTGNTQLSNYALKAQAIYQARKQAKFDYKQVAQYAVTFYLNALNSGIVTIENGGVFSVPHFLKKFESIPAGKESCIIDKITRKYISIREAEWINCKEAIKKVLGNGRAFFEIESIVKDENGKRLKVIPFRDFDWNNKNLLENSKLKVTIKPLNGVDTNVIDKRVDEYTC